MAAHTFPEHTSLPAPPCSNPRRRRARAQALPLLSAEHEKQMGAAEGGRAWWRWQDTASSSRPSLSAQYSGWEEAYSSLLAALKEHHPIDGVLGGGSAYPVQPIQLFSVTMCTASHMYARRGATNTHKSR